jgi:hypothetical protein
VQEQKLSGAQYETFPVFSVAAGADDQFFEYPAKY